MRNRMSCLKLLPALAIAALGSHALAAPSLVSNGSFEATATPGQHYFYGDVTGWSGGGNLTLLDTPGTADANGSLLTVYGPFPNTSPAGGNFVEGDGDPSYSNAISQNITGLVVGDYYAVTFYQAAGQQLNFQGPTTERWAVSLGAATQLSDQYSLPQGGVGAWQPQSLVFTATDTAEILSFLATGTPGGAPPISFLDGVSVTDVPEPSSLFVFGAGLAGLGVLVRLRRRGASATA